MSTKIPIWLDCDPGHDDAFAILFAAHHPQIRILGISTIHGNASLQKTTQNALSVLEAIGCSRIPVHPGAHKPYCRPPHHAPDIHGESGLDGTTLLPKSSQHPLTACNTIVDMYEALIRCPPNTAFLIATGSLTNAGLLFSTFPDLVQHLKGFNIMGGAIGDGFTPVPLGPSFHDDTGTLRSRIGNHTPYAEFNIWCDPESAASLFSNRELAKKTMMAPLDLTHQAFADIQAQQMVLHGKSSLDSDANLTSKPTKLRQMFHELLMFFAHTYAEVFDLKEGPPLHDPLAVAFVLATHTDQNDRIWFDDRGGERWHVDVELAGVQLGRTKVSKADEGVIIPRGFDHEKFWAVLENCLEAADKVSPLNEE